MSNTNSLVTILVAVSLTAPQVADKSTVAPLSVSKISGADFVAVQNRADSSVVIVLGKQEWETVKSSRHLRINDFPLGSEVHVDLELTRFTTFDWETKFVVGTALGDSAVTPPNVALFKGKVDGDSSSMVFLGLAPGGTNGIIVTSTTTYYVSPHPVLHESAGVLSAMIGDEQHSINPLITPTTCHVVEGNTVPVNTIPQISEFREEQDVQRVYLAALDGTFTYFQLMGGDLERSFVYLVELAAAATVIFERDLDSKIWLNYARVWAVQDPFLDLPPDSANPRAEDPELDDFQNWWEENMSSVGRHFACKVTNSFGGGLAHEYEICELDDAYSVCGLTNGQFPNPITQGSAWWDLFVIMHEWGHTWGSPHTHCYDPPLDLCFNTDPGCYSGPVTCERGTIMSYCHLCFGIGGDGNIDPYFHPTCISLIKSRITAPGCIAILATDVSYVDVNSQSQFESGTEENPWKTLAAGIRGVKPGGVVMVKPGDYLELPTGNQHLWLYSNCSIQRWGTSGTVTIRPQ